MGLLPSESVLFPREVWNSPAFGQVSQGVFCQGHLKSLLLQVRAALGWVWPQGSGIPHPLVALKLWALPRNPLRAVRSLTFFFPCLFISVDLILLNLWQRSLMEILNRAAAMQQENKELPPTPRPFPIYLPIKKNYNFFFMHHFTALPTFCRHLEISAGKQSKVLPGLPVCPELVCAP